MKYKFPEIKDVDIDTLLRIAQEKFPEYKIYTQRFLIGKALCINRNPFCRAIILVKHNRKKDSTTLVVNSGLTVLGCLFGGGFWVLFSKSFFEEVGTTYYCELA